MDFYEEKEHIGVYKKIESGLLFWEFKVKLKKLQKPFRYNKYYYYDQYGKYCNYHRKILGG